MEFLVESDFSDHPFDYSLSCVIFHPQQNISQAQLLYELHLTSPYNKENILEMKKERCGILLFSKEIIKYVSFHTMYHIFSMK